jgi:hypothetical protein
VPGRHLTAVTNRLRSQHLGRQPLPHGMDDRWFALFRYFTGQTDEFR